MQFAVLYSFDLDPARPTQALRKVAELPIRYPVTGADLSPDGKRLAIISIGGPYLFDVPADMSDLSKAKPAHVFFMHHRMEACCFVAEGILATTEQRDIFLFKWKDFGVAPPK
jgi:hypothetical protein